MTVKKVKKHEAYLRFSKGIVTATSQNEEAVIQAVNLYNSWERGQTRIEELESQLKNSKKLEYSKIPEGCGFICHICKPCVAMPLEHRLKHMQEVHHALKW